MERGRPARFRFSRRAGRPRSISYFMLAAQNLSKRYGARAVLRGLSFEVAPGTVAAVAGANGAGKSTLLKIVAGLVRWNGGSPRGFCALFAPDAPLYRELTALENLRFFAPDASGEADLRAHLEKWGLETRAHAFAGDLSSGLRARLQLAVAARQKAPILLLDEPSAHLDGAGRALVARLLEEQRAQGIALVATNDPRDFEFCDRRIIVGGE